MQDYTTVYAIFNTEKSGQLAAGFFIKMDKHPAHLLIDCYNQQRLWGKINGVTQCGLLFNHVQVHCLPVRILHKKHLTNFHETSKGALGKQTNIFHLTR